MKIALREAAMGLGAVEPNPMVGAVIVRDGVEIARGHHRRFGGPHAEIEAMRAVADEPLAGATMYVTLEPCCHRNKKTPPCTDALIVSGISRVVVAMEDPDVNVRGSGVAAMRAAGIEVEVGMCEAEARKLLAPYIKLRTLAQPWVIAKWAQTTDGYLALPEGQGRWISNELSREHVHRVRAVCDGILVGVGTVMKDDPMLNCRVSDERGANPHPPLRGDLSQGRGEEERGRGEEKKGEERGARGEGRQPLRIVLDSQLRIPLASKLIQTIKEYKLLIAASAEGVKRNRAKVESLRQAGTEVLELPLREPGRLDLRALLDELGRRQHTRLLVEGGPTVLREVLAQGLADELMVYISPLRVGPVSMDLPRLDIAELAGGEVFSPEEERCFGQDRLLRFLRQ